MTPTKKQIENEPAFWVPRRSRLLTPGVGHSPTRPKLTEATDTQYHDTVRVDMLAAYQAAWMRYDRMMARGIAAEVARSVLPLAVYTRCRMQCNPRSLMHFLSLRTHEPEASVTSYPQAEIEEPARACEAIFAAGWPLTCAAWQENGRVAP